MRPSQNLLYLNWFPFPPVGWGLLVLRKDAPPAEAQDGWAGRRLGVAQEGGKVRGAQRTWTSQFSMVHKIGNDFTKRQDQADFTNDHYYEPHQADADPSRHVVPSRHFMPLQSKYEEADSKIHRHEAQTYVKNRYKSKFISSDQKRLQTHATLTASPHFGNAGKPRPQRKRQLKVDRTKSHQTDVR